MAKEKPKAAPQKLNEMQLDEAVGGIIAVVPSSLEPCLKMPKNLFMPCIKTPRTP